VTRREYLPFGKPNFSDQEIAAVTRVLRSGWVGMGPETVAFERELATYVGAPHVVTVNSCTSALFLSLLVSGIGQGDEVVCPSLTWCSTANAALYLGAKPVFCDVARDTLCPTVDHILAKVTRKTRAVMVVHFGGLAVDVGALRKALPRDVVIVEDAAHALGARFADGARVGSSGNLTCFSFYANKNLSTGEGGAIALSDERQAERLQSLRQHALPLDAWKRFTQPKTLLLSNPLGELGYKMNYTDLQASIGRVQLARQATLDGIRLDIARRYVDGLKDVLPRSAFQSGCTHAHHARHLFVLQLPDRMRLVRDKVLLSLRAKNIGASIHYAPLHLMPLYAGRTPPDSLPTTEAVAARIMTLPISSSMTLDDADDVLVQLRAALKEHRWKPARKQDQPRRRRTGSMTA
jgi:dTDP-4-amino-4,6-dideoxygalactose transaminase